MRKLLLFVHPPTLDDMRSFVALALLPLVSGASKSKEETRAPQGVAIRVPLGRSFRYRPPVTITPHVFKVFDARIAREEILGVKSKYRDAERILRGVDLGPLIELPNVYKSKKDWESAGNDTFGLDPPSNGTFSNLDLRNDTLGAFWTNDLQPRPEGHTSPSSPSSPGDEHRCVDEGGENGTTCDILPSGSSGETGHEMQAQSTPSDSILPVPDNTTLPDVPLAGAGQSPDQMDSAHMKVMDYIIGGLDVLYYGALEFGSPSQEIMLDIDTGSADLWIPAKCSTCDTKQFDSDSSTTFEDSDEPFKVTYGSGWAQGTVAQDRVALGNLHVEHQHLGVATDVSEDFRGSPASGVLGMAFGSISTMQTATFFENLVLTTQVTAPLFGVHLTRGKEQGSETYWSVEMTGYSLGGSVQLYDAPITAAIDTGSTLIYLPMHEAEVLYGHIPGSRQAAEFGDAIWAFPCSSQLQLSLRFGTRLFQIHPWDFNLGRTDAKSDECVGGILGLPEGFPSDFAIIGDEFLKSFYDYADNGKIGLAYSANNK
ncbi:hypothetical protein FRC08_009930 [Ceratobasidium sp. 394]|nr:hypothetical protein FRC08_009930 [Ceratobasidium sp. 394]